jgi:Mg2+/Co2+ transporter CorB
MDADLWIPILAVLACLVISLFFSGSETALTASSRARMHALEKAGDERATIVNRLQETRERLIGGILIGNNIVNTAAASLTTARCSRSSARSASPMPTVVAALVIVFSEVLAKTIAINYPDRVALAIASHVLDRGPVRPHHPSRSSGWCAASSTCRRAARRSAEPCSRPRRRSAARSTLLHKEGGCDKNERDMLGGLLDLEDLMVSEVMVHRTKMRTINADLSSEEIVREVLASPYTRLPLWRGSQENIVGVLHAKDLLRALDAVGGDPTKLKVEAIALRPGSCPTPRACATS